MATQLFKDGQTIWVDTSVVQRHREAGWLFDDPKGPTPTHPDTIIPAGMGLENMPRVDQERTILKAMGIDASIENMTSLNPANNPQKAAPIEVIGAAKEPPRQKRAYTKRK